MAAKKTATKRTEDQSTHEHRVAFGVGIGIVILAVVVVVAAAGMVYAYSGKVLPRTSVAGVSITGKTQAEVAALVDAYREKIEKTGIVFSYGGRNVTLYPVVTATDDPDITYELFAVDPDATAAAAFVVGHHQSWTENVKDMITVLISGRMVPVANELQSDAVYSLLTENFGSADQPAANGALVYADGAFTVTGEHAGQVLDYQSALTTLQQRINNLSPDPITLNLVTDTPTVTYADAQGMITAALTVLQRAPLTLRADDETTWEVNKDTLGSWLTVTKERSKTKLSLKEDLVTAFLADKKAVYDVALTEGKFTLTNGRVSEFQPSQEGKEIITDESITAISDAVIGSGKSEATLVVKTTEPGKTTDEVNQLGIKELIGIGTSNFSGSPTNRRKNIAIGAALLNGQLIQPDEDFSLVGALNHFNPADGWLPELVIKGNKTVPEIGGGACQFGTTMFRTALNAGLPILERRNHSYTVRYYYPIGTDATIYDPSPDFRFKNDTGHAILIQTHIDGDVMTFEMWGTSDGRIATQTDPVLSNWVNPPEKKIIETTDLAPGQTKCTELAHKGVTARFDYEVTYASGEVKNDTFTSVYKPWQEVCLVGVDPATATTETQ